MDSFHNSYVGQKYLNEESFNAHIYSLFKDCCSNLCSQENGIILVNGEKYLYLIDSTFESDRKPDYLLLHKSFFVKKAESHSCDYYGTIVSECVDLLLFTFEGKIENIQADKNLI